MNKQRLYWVFQLLGWTTYGLAQFFLLAVDQEVDITFLWIECAQTVIYIFLTHFFRFIILQLGWLSYKWYGLLPRIFAGNIILSIAHFLLLIGISYLFGTFNPSLDLRPLTITATLFQSIVLFLFWSLIYLSFHYFERYNRSLQYEAAIKEIELSNLKSQLNPHFIFNALNSIRALVDENPNKSKNAITQLSNILRNSLSTERQRLVPFNEELKMVNDYLSLESIRYEERLKVKYNIPSSASLYQIPPLMLQTLVENCIKHGISTLKKGGFIEISAFESEKGLNIVIRNSGKFLLKDPKSVGYGLQNTRKRLELIFGEQSSFSIAEESKSVVRTEIVIPKSI